MTESLKRFQSHAALGIRAARLLPQWEQEILASSPAGEELQLLPPCRSALELLAFDCLLMDWLYDGRFRFLALQRNGDLLPHGMPDRSGKAAFLSGHPADPGKCFEMIRDLLESAVAELKKGDISSFCRRGGILGHFLQDLTAPNHNIHPQLLCQLFPDPVEGRFERLKYCYEIAPELDLEEDFSVMPAGDTIEKAAFFLTDRALKYASSSRKFLPSLVEASYARDRESCGQILKSAARWAVELTATAWHTVFLLAFGRTGDFSLPDRIPLSELYCAGHHPDIYAFAPPGSFYIDGKSVPLSLRGESGKELFSHGIALTGHSGVKFFTGGIFRELSFTLGLADDITSYDEHIDLDFSVETSPEWLDIFSEDMEYGTRRCCSIHLTSGSTTQKVKADIRGSRTLVLASRASSFTGPDGAVTFAIPHLCLGEAELRM